MKKCYRKILSLTLALALALTGITVFSQPTTVMALESASMTTENIDDPVEATVNAEVYFVHRATEPFALRVAPITSILQ